MYDNVSMPIDGIEWDNKKVKAGQKPNKAEMARIRVELREAAKHPIVYDDDSPKLPPEALKEFAFMAAERNRRRQAVTIRVVPDCLTKYKSLGRGYTGIMADVLNYVANNPKILSRASAGSQG